MAEGEKKKTTKPRAVAVVEAADCTGCEVCELVCPVDAIQMQPVEGDIAFLARVDDDTCTGCNLCAIDCPWEAITMQYPDGTLADIGRQLAKARGYV